ncbi:aldehyde dehydrogenase family protein [Pandoraea nosoerga]|uniref:Sulfoacetaldehyde dehydrogenase n=1 Tax=Pandoraea nosoerga TaxID=2508296 RepID=A0A5E4SN63_9BURK|nr:aldehyde dehydrogenase family protein [Pandoraea nosoerga]MBN4665230.1 aldehyde dehydrogenase family protein [Pandoraea nosoerga]MBN4674631.1 aldehyde dehydrogenase family protein [Pandoraea nosoerga]MBN4680519.1 aldehyde dehydrogenase family protein [Pandoraea nosoerga]MBN4743924.1 aldehyde dehydrogenase family protein [Pandoraea nosoerga]VVD76511.1 sulfoacetaldehyde dehydrogenase [Pandoraea nosoerga]
MNSRAFGAVVTSSPQSPLPQDARSLAATARAAGAACEQVQVAELVARARAAQRTFAIAGQRTLDTAASAAAWAIMEPARNRQLAELAVADTGLGNVDDKIQKNFRKTLGLLRDLHGRRTTGVIAQDAARGIVEIARAVGVVAAITPSTNPAATPANKIINALKCGNAVIVAPSPKGYSACALLLRFIHAELAKASLSPDLVQMLPAPISKAATAALMQQVDLVVATGSQANVRMAYTSGTPAFGVGAGNVASIVTASADLADAAQKIARSKTFDNATSCSSENSVVIEDAVYAPMIEALRAAGGVLLDEAQKRALQAVMWVDGKLSAQCTAKSAQVIARLAGLASVAAQQPAFLMVEETGTGADHPFSGEKLSPVLTVYRARDFVDAMSLVERLYAYMGAGHSVGLHGGDPAQAVQLGQTLPVARVIVNQAHCFATGGNFDNGLPFSLSMGCGTWGKNNFTDNLGFRQYLNVTRVAYPIAAVVPEVDDLLADYFGRFGR